MRKSDPYKLKTVEGDCGPEYHIVPKDAPESEPKEKSHNPVTAQRRLLYWNALETVND